MPDIAPYVIVGSLAQAVGSLVLGLLLLGFHRREEHAWTRHWAWSWLALMVYLAGSAASMAILPFLPATHPLRLAVTFASLTGAYLQVVWLVAGSWEVRTGRALPARRMRSFLAAAAGMALLCTVAYAAPRDAFAERLFMWVGMRSLVLMVALLASARLAWPSDGGERRAGRRMAATGFVLFAAQRAVYGGLSLAVLGGGAPASWSGLLGMVDFLLEWIIGLGMVMILLEQQRAGALRGAADAERLALHDPLTGLPNRRLLRERLRAAVAAAGEGSSVAVAFVDLDRFKVINDSLGHAAGDDLLWQAGTRLRLAVPEPATVSRLGGDEFVLVLPGVADGAESGAMVRRALDTLRAPFWIGGHELFVTASAGISVGPEDGADPDTLVRQADLAMYRAKAERSGGVAFYTPEMQRQARERLETETELRRALADDQLVLAYQPVMEVATGRISGVEALLRWRHPVRGLLGPCDFLQVAEAAGLIVPIGAWVLRTACARAAAWAAADGFAAPRLMVNLSARQFVEPDLACTITAALADAGLAPGLLELEITESMAMEDVAATEAVLRGLKDAGVRISIDDFGTGYSSFEYLRRFPIDTLKVDRGFVAQVEDGGGDAEIVAAIVAMAHRLGLVVVGEGVETEGQLAFLREQGCDAVQGFLVARPMSGDEMDLFLARPLALVPAAV